MKNDPLVRRRAIVVLLCVLMLGVVGMVVEFLIRRPRMPSDQDLLTNFKRNQQTFETLRRMMNDDSGKIQYVSSSTLNGSGLNGRRQQDYRKLLSEISSGLVVVVDGEVVRFIFKSRGLFAFGAESIKGIEYLPQNRQKEGIVVNNLDASSGRTSGVYLRPIESNWFVFYQHDD